LALASGPGPKLQATGLKLQASGGKLDKKTISWYPGVYRRK